MEYEIKVPRVSFLDLQFTNVACSTFLENWKSLFDLGNPFLSENEQSESRGYSTAHQLQAVAQQVLIKASELKSQVIANLQVTTRRPQFMHRWWTVLGLICYKFCIYVCQVYMFAKHFLASFPSLGIQVSETPRYAVGSICFTTWKCIQKPQEAEKKQIRVVYKLEMVLPH